MVTHVNSSLPAVVIQTRSYATPIIAALAFAAIGYLLIQIAKSLMGRVQPMPSAESLYAQGCDDYSAGKYAEAIQKFALALQRMPDQQLQLKKLADLGAACAANFFESAIDSYLDRATSFADQNDHAQAILVYTRALELPFSDDDHALIFCRRAASHYNLENYALSLSDFNAGFALNPQDQYLRAEILTHRAGINIKMNQTETVLQDLADALACNFDDPKLRRFIYSARGDFCAKTGAHEKAVEDYNWALYCKPYKDDVFAQIVYKRGACFLALEQWDDAISDFTDAFAKKFSDDQLRAWILVARADIYITREQFQLAASDLNAAIAFNPSEDLDQLLYMRGKVFTELNRFPEAIVDFTKAIEMNPSDPNLLMRIYSGRGYSNVELGKFDDAISDLIKALGYDPQDPKERAGILYQRGCAYGCHEKFDLCEVDVTAAIACSPTEDRIPLLWTRGEARLELKRYPEAIQDFTTAMCIHPEDEEWKALLLHGRGIAHRENKSPDQAHQDFEAALRCNFTKEGLREAIEADLNPKKAPPAGIISTFWGSAMSKWNGGSKK